MYLVYRIATYTSRDFGVAFFVSRPLEHIQIASLVQLDVMSHLKNSGSCRKQNTVGDILCQLGTPNLGM